jgi:hypothetical protein
MYKLILIASILICSSTIYAQSVGKVLVVGDPSVADSARVELLTQSPSVSSLGTVTHSFDNGPTAEENYKDHVLRLGYNSAANGTKLIPGEVHFALSHESKYRNGVRKIGIPNFQTEIYYEWTNPEGTKTIRPWSFSVQHADSSIQHVIHGEVWFFRNIENGNTPTGQLKDDGTLDLSLSPTGAILFPNNSSNAGGLRFRSAFSNNTIAPLYLDNQDRVRIAASGQQTVFGGTIEAPSVKVGGAQVLGNQCPPIPDTNGSLADNQRAINSLLQCLRAHGALASEVNASATNCPPTKKKDRKNGVMCADALVPCN